MSATADTIRPTSHWQSTAYLVVELVALILLGWFPWRIRPYHDELDVTYVVSWALVILTAALVLIICGRSLFIHSWRAAWAVLWNVLLIVGALGLLYSFAVLYAFTWGPM